MDLPSSQAVLVYPEKVNLPFDTVPTGLSSTLMASRVRRHSCTTRSIGFNHTIEAQINPGDDQYTLHRVRWGSTTTWNRRSKAHAQSYTATYIATPILLPQGLVAAWNFSEGAGTAQR